MGNTKTNLPSAWQINQNVQVVFPGNSKLQGKIVKVAFNSFGDTLYDVSVPFVHTGDGQKEGHFRIHGVGEWFLSHTQEDWDKMNGKNPQEEKQCPDCGADLKVELETGDLKFVKHNC